jgi:hypothetical protein
MKATAVNANAKREMKATPVRLRIEWLKANGLVEPEGPGRPAEFRDAFCSEATHLCRLGATDKDLAEFFEVDERTINRWKHDHPEFCQSIKAPLREESFATSTRTRARVRREAPARHLGFRTASWVRSLRSYCRTEGAPAMTTIHSWRDTNDAFRAMYNQARDMQADTVFDEIIDIADTEPDLDRARIMIDARKLIASRMAPRKYGTSAEAVHGPLRIEYHAKGT